MTGKLNGVMPKGARVYRIRVEDKPRPVYLEVREDQLELLPEE
jgi:hypothetical protein